MISAAAVRDFQLTRVPPAFLEDPYPWYAALREHDPVHALEGGGVFLSRYEDALAVYRDPHASSDKKAEFRPKLGDSPLYEHHTTSLVFNDPPLHTRVRRLIGGALTPRHIAAMEERLVQLVERGLKAVGMIQDEPEVVACQDVPAVERERAVKAVNRAVDVHVGLGQAEREPAVGVVWRFDGERPRARAGFGRPPGFHQRQDEMVRRAARRRPRIRRRAKRLDGGIERADPLQRFPEMVLDDAVVRREA